MANAKRFPSVFGPMIGSTPVGSVTLALNAAGTWLALGFVLDAAKTLAKVRVFTSAVNGTLGASDLSADLCSGTSTSPVNPSTILQTSTTVTATPTGAATVEFTGFSTALTAATQYYIQLKNLNGTPATNFPTYRFGSQGSAPPAGAGSSLLNWGWLRRQTTDSGSTWSTSPTGMVVGLRLEFSDGSFAGFPFSNVTTSGTDMVYSAREYGAMFTLPAGDTLNVRGLLLPAGVLGTPTGDLRAKLYSGSGGSPTLLATSLSVPRVAVATGLYAFPLSSPVALPASATYRVVLSETTNSDTSSNAFRATLAEYVVDNDANSRALLPYSSKKTYYNGTAWSEDSNAFVPWGLILDTDGEFTSGSAASASDLRSGVVAGGVTGTLVVPAASTVLSGTTYDNGTTGTVTLPTAAQVLVGVGFGAGGTALTGTVTLPAAGDVRLSTTFGASLGSTGTLKLPGVGFVQTGQQYGAGGTEYTGTLATTGISQGDLDASLAPIIARLPSALVSGRMDCYVGDFNPSLGASGPQSASLDAVLSTALTETATGRLSAALKKFLDVPTPTLTAAGADQTGDSYARIGANGANLTAVASTDPWATLTTGTYNAGTFGAVVKQFTFDTNGFVKADVESVEGVLSGDAAVGTLQVALSADALDSIVVEPGLNARQALAVTAAAAAGKVSGAGTGTVTILAAAGTAQRIQARTDALGNRTSVTVSPPA